MSGVEDRHQTEYILRSVKSGFNFADQSVKPIMVYGKALKARASRNFLEDEKAADDLTIVDCTFVLRPRQRRKQRSIIISI